MPFDQLALAIAEKDTTGAVFIVGRCRCGGVLTRQWVGTQEIRGPKGKPYTVNLVRFTCSKGGDGCLR